MDIPAWVDEVIAEHDHKEMEHFIFFCKKADEPPKGIVLPITFPKPLHARFLRAFLDFEAAEEVLIIVRATIWASPKEFTGAEGLEMVQSIGVLNLPGTQDTIVYSYERKDSQEHATKMHVLDKELEVTRSIPESGWAFTTFDQIAHGIYEGLFQPFPTIPLNFDGSSDEED